MIRSTSQKDISIIIPVYNEQDNLKPLISELREVLDRLDASFEIIVVDDGSRDRSFGILKEAASHDPQIRAIRFRKNTGQTAAFDAGFRAAQADIVGFLVVMFASLLGGIIYIFGNYPIHLRRHKGAPAPLPADPSAFDKE
jgi:glycosyltransferase involved in cell wall biosynthesis